MGAAVTGVVGPTGKLGVSIAGDAGFNIRSDLRRGRTVASRSTV